MFCEVRLYSTCVRDSVEGQLITALVPTVPSLCFLVHFSTIAKVEKHFGDSFVFIYFMFGELLSEVDGQVGHGLVRVVRASPGLLKHFFTISRESSLVSCALHIHELQLSVQTCSTG